MLTGKRIVLGVTGGIAAYKAAELARLLVKAHADVQVVMTRAATGFITPLTFHALTSHVVVVDAADDQAAMAHIALARGRDAILVAPATADFLARLAGGHADDVLTQICLARDCPLWVAPAMNRLMWQHPSTRRNMTILQGDGVHVLGPADGSQACGEIGPGRLLEPEEIVAGLLAYWQPGALAGRRVLVTAGPTLEKIDPVRALTNLSSGRMGYAVAQAAAEAGAQVILISGPVCLAPPTGMVAVVAVESADEMFAAVQAHLAAIEVFISVAAVADFRPQHIAGEKIKKAHAPSAIELVPTVDILAHVAALPDAPFCVGFAAETSQLVAHGHAKRQAKRLPLLVVNQAQTALGGLDNELLLLDDQGEHRIARTDKLSAARQLMTHVARLLAKKA